MSEQTDAVRPFGAEPAAQSQAEPLAPNAGEFRCCGCGKPLDLNEYRSCDCPTSVGRRRDTGETMWKKNRCAWCDAIPTLANIDGEDLCHACCNKWARAEGVAAAEMQEADEAPIPRTPNAAPDDLTGCWYDIEDCSLPYCDCAARTAARDSDGSGEAGQTAKQAGPEGRQRGPCEDTASPKTPSETPNA